MKRSHYKSFFKIMKYGDNDFKRFFNDKEDPEFTILQVKVNHKYILCEIVRKNYEK